MQRGTSHPQASPPPEAHDNTEDQAPRRPLEPVLSPLSHTDESHQAQTADSLFSKVLSSHPHREHPDEPQPTYFLSKGFLRIQRPR